MPLKVSAQAHSQSKKSRCGKSFPVRRQHQRGGLCCLVWGSQRTTCFDGEGCSDQGSTCSKTVAKEGLTHFRASWGGKDLAKSYERDVGSESQLSGRAKRNEWLNMKAAKHLWFQLQCFLRWYNQVSPKLKSHNPDYNFSVSYKLWMSRIYIFSKVTPHTKN